MAIIHRWEERGDCLEIKMFKYLRIISKNCQWIVCINYCISQREQLSKSELDNKNAVDVDCKSEYYSRWFVK